MSQRKRPVPNSAVATEKVGAGASKSGLRSSRNRGTSSGRRGVTFALIVAGIAVAAWVILASMGLGGKVSSQPPSSAASLDAVVGPLMERLRQNPSDMAAMVELGNSYYDAGRWADAIPWYEKALQLAPTNTDVRTDLGTAYYYSGNAERAKEEWSKVLEQDPNKVQAHYNLAILYSHATPPQMDAAAKEWETVIRLAPGSEQAKAAETQLKAIGKR